LRVSLACLLLFSSVLAEPIERAATDVLVERMRDDDYTKRKEAMKQLTGLLHEKKKPEALAALLDFWKTEEDPEVKVRLHGLLKEHFLRSKRAFLGVAFEVNSGLEFQGKRVAGLKILRVLKGESADRAGVLDGDILLAIDGKPFPATSTHDGVRSRIARLEAGQNVSLAIMRGDEQREIRLQLGARTKEHLDRKLDEQLFENWFREQTKKSH